MRLLQISSLWASLHSLCIASAISLNVRGDDGVLGPANVSATFGFANNIDPANINTLAARDHQKTGFKAIGYFVNWGIYGRNYKVNNLAAVADQLTHVNYAFANVNKTTGEVFLSDPWSDVQIPYPADNTNEAGNNLYGNFKQLNLLKQKNRRLKVMLAVGGWTYSPNFAAPASTPGGRQKFADSCVELVKNLGLDGIEVDWEYPENEQQANDYVELLKTLRLALNKYTEKYDGSRQLISVACPAGPSKYNILKINAMNKVVDIWNLMAYDYSGSWDKIAGHNSNMFPSLLKPASTPFNTEQAIKAYLKAGVGADKLILGMPIYGRAFEQTEGVGTPYTGVGAGTWEAGVYDYKTLPQSGAKEFFDPTVVASGSYDAAKKIFISYDTPKAVVAKAEIIKKLGLGGAMWWELSADKIGADSLLGSVVKTLGGTGALEERRNTVKYPGSTYDNLRKGL